MPKPKAKVIRFTKLRQWYIPADVETYRLLHRRNLPDVRYHEEFFPTLQLVTRKANIRAVLVPFADIWNEFTAKVDRAWVKNPKRKCSWTSKSALFESRDMQNARRSFPELESCLRTFFARWGYTSEFTYSESPTRAKLSVSFKFDTAKHPIIEFMDT